ncbi:protein Wnt-2b-A-like [Gordionus sp. m RMFG-2023]|uniref:protein Wnt-2b-A-like n=1 Tax=Gordionus sp. m RMFG-2023 TaxID=3053472 RepID=UPI0031FC61D3
MPMNIQKIQTFQSTFRCCTSWFISKLSTQSLGMGSLLCNTIPGLMKNQKHLCHNYPESMIILRNGLKMGVRECQNQFHKHRWNCSMLDQNSYFLGKFLLKGTRETAFLYSISSAGIAYSLIRSCSRGEMKGCACDPRKINGKVDIDYTGQLFTWAGCSDNIDFGCKFSRIFIDAKEKLQRDGRALMNIHNNKVGRKAVKKAVKLECKCHGMSGSCNIRTCWRSMNNFAVIGKYLKTKYDNGYPIMINQDGSSLIAKRDTRKQPKMSDLVYLEDSPSFCQQNLHAGSMGTAGRPCKKTSLGPDGCLLLCCGRGYDTRLVMKIYKCHCKFQWCCKVRCKECRKWTEEYFCKGEPKLEWNSIQHYVNY